MRLRIDNTDHRIAKACALLVTAAGGLGLHAANAQDLLPEKTVGVQDRPRPEFDPLGIRLGSFRIAPRLSLGEAYNDNIFATDSAESSDFITDVAGDVSVGADWRVPWNLSGGFNSYRYADNSSQDYDDWHGALLLNQAITSRAKVTLDLGLARNHEMRGDPAFPSAATEPPAYDTKRAELAVTQTAGFGQIKLVADLEASDYQDARLGDGTVFDQDSKDRTVWDVDLRADVATGPNSALFIRATHRQQSYDISDSRTGLDRNAKSDAIYGGAAVWITNLVRGDIGVGYLQVDNSDPSQKDPGSVAFTANLEFFLTQLLTATLEARRTAGSADIEGSSSYVQTLGSIRLDYEFRRNVIVTANYSQTASDYSGLGASDDSKRFSLAAQWLCSRHARIGVKFVMEDRDYALTAIGRSFRQNVISADLGLTW